MLKIIMYSLICIAALYGLFHAAGVFLRHIPALPETYLGSIKAPYTVLTVKNQADSIEAAVRSAVWHMLARNRTRTVGDLIVIDLGSTDDTPAILHQLEHEYEFVHPMSRDNYIEFIKGL